MRRVVFAILPLLLLAGCGGGGDESGGTSFQQQFRDAKSTSDPQSRAVRLVQLAYQQHNAGTVEGVRESLAAAGEAARQIEGADAKAETLATVAYAAGAVGWLSEASELVKDVRGAIEDVENQEVAAAATAKMAAVYGVHLDNARAAEVYIAQAEEIAGNIEDPESRARALVAIAGRRFELKQPEEAARLTEEASDLARSLEDPRRRADLLAEVADRYHKIGRSEQALSTFDEATAAAESIPDNYVSQSYALLNIASKLHAAGYKEQARAALAKTEQAADQILDQGQKGPFMTKLHQLRDRIL